MPKKIRLIPVTEMKVGGSAHVVKLDGGDEFKKKLRVIGIREGKTILLITQHPLGGPIVVQIDGRKTTLGRRMARRILVEVF